MGNFPMCLRHRGVHSEQIKVPAGNHPVLTAHAKGDQIYQCSLSKGVYAWQTHALMRAYLMHRDTSLEITLAGPVWEYKEGSRVLGQVVSKIDIAPETSISWLLVEVVAHKGNGFFSNVSFINRINTHGGLPPLSVCNANHLGTEKRVAYTADYIFYGK